MILFKTVIQVLTLPDADRFELSSRPVLQATCRIAGNKSFPIGLTAVNIIAEIRGDEVDGLADFYRKVWTSGPAGAEIPMRVLRKGGEAWLRVKSGDRNSFLRKPQLQ